MADPVPLIGVTTYLERAVQGPWDERFGMVPETYLLGVEEGGGAPLLLPPQPVDGATVDRVLSALDGLVLSGGADVDPARYGADRHPRTQAPRADRDAWELALAAGAVRRDLPVLAICRGVQVLDVALGGTLLQHVPDVTAADHGEAPGAFAPTPVDTVAGTHVRELLGEDRLTVHCHHHQAIDRVAPDLVVAARSADGLVEAVELPGAAFVVGVQWHPEQDAADRRLFAALVRAAGRRAARTPVPSAVHA
ncbi:gamma-glutamyl-gamma-aminobutyrate hydrolase family protein [Amnibacterium endophyticum]|uniref:Gamma-glutamyl-gamma-aminobutyrate hydrolase family protein n=1 Tax=Amnibacterium endophyticum TaxID=2109337 RepID=A0ABW4LAP2_9MICO